MVFQCSPMLFDRFSYQGTCGTRPVVKTWPVNASREWGCKLYDEIAISIKSWPLVLFPKGFLWLEGVLQGAPPLSKMVQIKRERTLRAREMATEFVGRLCKDVVAQLVVAPVHISINPMRAICAKKGARLGSDGSGFPFFVFPLSLVHSPIWVQFLLVSAPWFTAQNFLHN